MYSWSCRSVGDARYDISAVLLYTPVDEVIISTVPFNVRSRSDVGVVVRLVPCMYSKHSPIRKSGLWALGGFSNSELSVGSVSYSCSYLFFLLTNRPSETFLI